MIDDDIANVTIDQTVVNVSGNALPAINVWPVPQGVTVERLDYNIGRRLVQAQAYSGYASDVLFRKAAERSDDPRLLAYLGRTLYRGDLGEVPARGELPMRMNIRMRLTTTADQRILFEHPLETNGFGSVPLDRMQLNVQVHSTKLIGTLSGKGYKLSWRRDSSHRMHGEYIASNVLPSRPWSLTIGRATSVTAKYEETFTEASEEAAREAGAYRLRLEDGTWTDVNWPKTPWRISIARFTPAYWELLWNRPDTKFALATGKRVRILVNGQAIEIGDIGNTEFTPGERTRLRFPQDPQLTTGEMGVVRPNAGAPKVSRPVKKWTKSRSKIPHP